MNTVAIILAAGSGKRMKANQNKMFLSFGGKTVLEHTADAFQSYPEVDGILVVGKETELEQVRKLLPVERYHKILGYVAGGKERQDSVLCGLEALPDSCDIVLIHDGARPFVKRKLITELLEQVTKECGTVAGVPSKDTVKQVQKDGMVQKTLDRSLLWNVQTPQCFYRESILKFYLDAAREGIVATDDASLAEYYGAPVKMVEAYYENIKLTTPEDMEIAEVFRKRLGEEA